MKGSSLEKARKLIYSNEVEIIRHPLNFLGDFLPKRKKSKKVTVVTPAFNAEKFISKTIDSVINQSIGIENIQYLIIDDGSTDNTRKIIKEYIYNNKHITGVFLKHNTGSPGIPRNIGIELAEGEYITFLDADDWLHEKGIEVLCRILDETGDDYVVGKTIKVESSGESIIGEYASVKERRSISPFDIPHFFYHMGPTARMIRLSLIKEHDLGFPEMKFAEDKLFFCDVLIHAKSVSTTTKPIYYVNRKDDNPSSLTRTTNVIDKRKSDLKVIEYIKSKGLPIQKEKIILNRIYEYDIVRTFDSQLFVKSDKKNAFLQILEQAIATTKDLEYDFKEEFKTPVYKAAVELFLENRIEDFVKLFQWLKNDSNKKYVIKNGLPYYEIPFFSDEYRHIRIPMLARALDSFVLNDVYYQVIEIYGDYINNINHILIRDRSRVDNDLEIHDFDLDGNILTFKVSSDLLDKLKPSLFTIFIRYNDYQLLNIKRILKNQIIYENKSFEFYTTKANNLGLNIKIIK